MKPRLPLGPLLDAIRAESHADAARQLGIHQRQIYRWLELGLSERQADELAVRVVNVHPMSIWPEWLPVA